MQHFDLYWMRPYAKKLVRRMDKHGYYYDEIESYKGNLRFFLEYGGVVYFESWKEVKYFLREAFC